MISAFSSWRSFQHKKQIQLLMIYFVFALGSCCHAAKLLSWLVMENALSYFFSFSQRTAFDHCDTDGHARSKWRSILVAVFSAQH